MPDEVTTPPAEPTPEPQSVREAIALRQSQPLPEFETDEPEVVAPVDDEAAAIEELTKPATPAPETTPAPEGDPFAQYGGKDVVERALQVHGALGTETGLRTVIAQGLINLGYSPQQIAAALDQQAPAGAGEVAPETNPYGIDIDDEEIVDGATLKATVERAVAAAVEKATAATKDQVDPRLAQFEEQRNRDISARNDATLEELLGTPPTDPAASRNYGALAGAVLAAAAPFVEPNNFDPSHIRNAIIRGHAIVTEAKEAEFKAYLARKAADRAAAPARTSGATGGEGEVAEPKNLKEASAAARAAGLFDA